MGTQAASIFSIPAAVYLHECLQLLPPVCRWDRSGALAPVSGAFPPLWQSPVRHYSMWDERTHHNELGEGDKWVLTTAELYSRLDQVCSSLFFFWAFFFPLISILHTQSTKADLKPGKSSDWVLFVSELTEGFQDMTDMPAHLYKNKRHISQSMSLPSHWLQTLFFSAELKQGRICLYSNLQAASTKAQMVFNLGDKLLCMISRYPAEWDISYQRHLYNVVWMLALCKNTEWWIDFSVTSGKGNQDIQSRAFNLPLK